MMSNQRYTEDFKREAVAQIAEHGYKIKDVSERVGVSDKSLYAWCKRYANPSQIRNIIREYKRALIAQRRNKSLEYFL